MCSLVPYRQVRKTVLAEDVGKCLSHSVTLECTWHLLECLIFTRVRLDHLFYFHVVHPIQGLLTIKDRRGRKK